MERSTVSRPTSYSCWSCLTDGMLLTWLLGRSPAAGSADLVVGDVGGLDPAWQSNNLLVMSLTGSDWATVVAAVASGAVAVLTGALAWSTRSMARATQDEVIAGRIERELAWRPHITFDDIGPSASIIMGNDGRQSIVRDPGRFNAKMTNIGTGPALHCLIVFSCDPAKFEGASVIQSKPTDFPGRSDGKPIKLDSVDGVPLDDILTPARIEGSADMLVTGAAFCQDIFGNRARFPFRGDGLNEIIWYPPEWCRTSEGGSRPSWADSKWLWPASES